MNNDNYRMYFDHLWKYFEIHANQRITLFRFYIAFFVFFITASGFLFIRFSYSGIFSEFSAIVLCLIFILITIIFQLLDNRNRQLIHYAEEGLEEIENQYFSNGKCFGKEKEDKNSRIHHTKCFLTIYISAYVLSSIFLVVSIIYLCCFGGGS